MSKFVHLHGHSEYSLLDGLSKVKGMVKAAKDAGMEALALTDHGAMYGIIEFYKECTKAGIKPLIGCELYVAKRSHKDKEGKVDAEPYHLTVIAKDFEGYQNLMKLVTIGNLDGYYYKPRVDRELLKEFSKGLVVLSGCPAGEFMRNLKEDSYKDAEEVAKAYLEIFGEGNYFFELQNHEYDHILASGEVDSKIRSDLEHMNQIQKMSFTAVKELSKKLGIQIVGTNDFHYVGVEDAPAQDALICVQTGKFIQDINRIRMIDVPNFYIRPPEEMEQLFTEVPEAITNTVKIADMCNVELTLGKPIFPIFNIPTEQTPNEYLRDLCKTALQEKYPDQAIYEERMEYELSIIEGKKFSTYFLIVQDFMKWASEHRIITNTRGSAAGSLVLHLLGITSLDPIEFALPFERFMNPLRPKFPDIDCDIADDRRDAVIRYIMDRYGQDKVAQVITFGTMMGRAAVRDIGRVLGLPYSQVDQIAKLIPPPHQGFHKPLSEAIKEGPELSQIYKSDAQVKHLLDLAQRVEGTVRHASVHAAGVVISPEPMTNYAPLQQESNGDKIITQYDMFSVTEDYEGVGLIKLDLLGIRNLSILGHSVDIVKANRGVEIDLNKLPLDDKKTYEVLGRGETMGLFQLEGSGMTRYLVELKPTNIYDIMAMIALYRPGPLASIPDYIARKHDPSKINFFDPRMKEYMQQSLGLLVYQEDVLLTAINIAGYDWLAADKLRKAMGKKIPEEMAKERDHFIEGCINNGMSKEKSDDLFRLIEPFAAYGFGKCLTSDTLLYNAKTGEKMTIKSLYESKKIPKLFSMVGNYKLLPMSISCVQENGVKSIFEVTTRRGLKIKSTDNHPYITLAGWKELKDLKIGDRIGTARIAPLPANPYLIDDYKIATLGYLLAEGNLCHPSGIYFYSTKQEEIDDFISNARLFKNAQIKLNYSKSAISVYIGRVNPKVNNELFDWVSSLGLSNKKATEKFLPDFVYQLNTSQLSLLLGKMWQGDGSISDKRDGHIFYSTASEEIARSIQHLLLRLGIISTIHKNNTKYRGMVMKGWKIHITRYTNIQRFAQTIGKHLISDKKQTCETLLKNHTILNGVISTLAARGSKDIIPVGILPAMKEEILMMYPSLTAFSRQHNLSVRLLGNDIKKIGYLRETVLNIGSKLNSERLLALAESDVYWDEIISIKPIGNEMTYDLTIPDTHNFVANDIIVHNSHAASYAMISYQTAYMKANYPVEFMAAVMTAESGDTEKIAHAMDECKKIGIVVLPPDVNRSKVGFGLEKFTDLTHEELQRSIAFKGIPKQAQVIRFGLSAIKNVGVSAIESIIKAREKGEFSSMVELCLRADSRLVNRKTLESLIKAGALDLLGSRAAHLMILDQCIEKVHKASKNPLAGQASLFNEGDVKKEINIDLPATEELSLDQMLTFEKELLGFYLHEPPYLALMKQVGDFVTHKVGDISEDTVGQRVVTGGIVTDVRKVITKKSAAEMAFLKISDGIATLDAVVFPKTYAECKSCLEKDKVVVIQGKIDNREDQLSLVVDQIELFDPNKTPVVEKNIEINVPKNIQVDTLKLINHTLRGYPGRVKVALVLNNGGNTLRRMELPFGVKYDPILVQQIEDLLGQGVVRLT